MQIKNTFKSISHPSGKTWKLDHPLGQYGYAEVISYISSENENDIIHIGKCLAKLYHTMHVVII